MTRHQRPRDAVAAFMVADAPARTPLATFASAVHRLHESRHSHKATGRLCLGAAVEAWGGGGVASTRDRRGRSCGGSCDGQGWAPGPTVLEYCCQTGPHSGMFWSECFGRNVLVGMFGRNVLVGMFWSECLVGMFWSECFGWNILIGMFWSGCRLHSCEHARVLGRVHTGHTSTGGHPPPPGTHLVPGTVRECHSTAVGKEVRG